MQVITNLSCLRKRIKLRYPDVNSFSEFFDRAADILLSNTVDVDKSGGNKWV